MKKLLKLLFVLSGTATLPLSVIACGQEDLDATLDVVRKGATKWSVEDFPNLDLKINPFEEQYSLSIEKANLLVKDIAEIILIKAKNENKIIWSDDHDVTVGQKCYDFKITNAEKSEDEKNLLWDAKSITGTFELKVGYLVGTLNDSNKFDAKQKLDMTFQIKVYQSESDTIVDEWVNNFNEEIKKQEWNGGKPLVITLKDEAIKLPEKGFNWTDLNEKWQQETYDVIKKQVSWDSNVGLLILSNEKVNEKSQLEIYLSINKTNATKTTETFFIAFAK